jgi:hypothetical protein
MDEMPQAEGWRARQEHGVLVARGLAKGVATIVEEATFTDALGTEFGLGYKLQRLKRRAEESFADGYDQGAKDAAKGIELEYTKFADLLRQSPNISGGDDAFSVYLRSLGQAEVSGVAGVGASGAAQPARRASSSAMPATAAPVGAEEAAQPDQTLTFGIGDVHRSHPRQ